MPVNRCSSVLAGLFATVSLHLIFPDKLRSIPLSEIAAVSLYDPPREPNPAARNFVSSRRVVDLVGANVSGESAIRPFAQR